MNRRVVVTGMGGITALGDSWDAIEPAIRNGRNAIRRMPEWDRFEALHTRLGGPVDGFRAPAHYERKHLRSMGACLFSPCARRRCRLRMPVCCRIPP